jgi:molecular chaperone GrpE
MEASVRQLLWKERQVTDEIGPEEGVVEEAKDERPAVNAAEDELDALRRELEQTKEREAEYLDGWQRARAELANARKRFQRDQMKTYSSAQADVLTRLLPTVDDFERAFETLPASLSGLTWIEGMGLIERKLRMLLEQSGVAHIEAVGAEFDPTLHQAVTHEPSDTVCAGRVIAELQKGYRMGDRILRPSMVRVSSGPEDEARDVEENFEDDSYSNEDSDSES